VEGILQGGLPRGPSLQQPAFATVVEDGILAVEPDGAAMRFRAGVPAEWFDPGETGARGAGSEALGVSARAVFDIPLRLLPRDAPLLWLHPADGDPIPADRAWRGRVPLLDGLLSSGWTAVDAQERVHFAAAARPEVRGYGSDGALRWINRWTPDREVLEPRFRVENGGLAPDFTLVHQGLAVGPDGLLYLLAPDEGDEGDGTREAALLVFGPAGEGILRWGSVPSNAAIYVGERGHVWISTPDEALSRTGESDRVPFEPFHLPRLDGPGDLRLHDYRGRVVVVNFWASWCVPCKQEMPLLDDLSRRMGPAAAVLGVNEDVRPQDGRAFLAGLGGVAFPSAEGRGDQQSRYHYRGLPYTVVLDRDGRVVRTFYGFGSTLDPVEEAVRSELARSGA